MEKYEIGVYGRKNPQLFYTIFYTYLLKMKQF